MHAPADGGPVTIPDLLARNVARHGAKPAYREKEFGIWQSWTWAQASEQIDALAMGLLTLGANVGDHVAVSGRNRPALYWAMVAAQRIGCIPVPLYAEAAAEEIAYALDHCGARFAVVGDQEQVDKIADVRDGLTQLDHVIYLDGRGLRKYDHAAMTSYADLQKAGRASGMLDQVNARSAARTYDDTCVMLYTSGTTGRPKGVVLSNRNVIETSKNSSEFDHLRADD